MNTPHILIVEDEERVATLLKCGLQEAGFHTTVCYDGDMGVRLFKERKIDLIISDVILPKISGFELCKIIRKNSNIPILMLTALGTTDDKLDGFDAGADDYMVKPFDFRELIARINVLLKRNSYEATSNNFLEYADLKVDLNTKKVYRGESPIELTRKEYQLLCFMLKNPEKVLSRKEIAEDVWDTHFDTGTNFIDVYINYLRKKVDHNYPVKLIHTRIGMGFILTMNP